MTTLNALLQHALLQQGGNGVVAAPLVPQLAYNELQAALMAAGARIRDFETGSLRCVQQSRDLDRIRGLPIRQLGVTENQINAMTKELRYADSTAELRPIQVNALQCARQQGGLFGFIGVGWGKTLIALLLPTVMESRNCVLLIRSQLKSQLKRDIARWQKEFRIAADNITVVTYEQLSTANTADLLEKLQPDLVIADECHKLRHRGSARTKRFFRFFSERRDVRFCGMSGSPGDSVLHYGPLVNLALRQRSPLPLHYPALVEWAHALDAPPKGQEPLNPGALKRVFCLDDEPVRLGYRRRLLQSPGIVASEDSSLHTLLLLHERSLSLPTEVRIAIEALRKTWTRPDGEELEDQLKFSSALQQLSLGFYLYWSWEGPPWNGIKDDEWLQARNNWHRAVRAKLKRGATKGMDSPLLLARAAQNGAWNCPDWRWWAAVKDRPAPPTSCKWLHNFAVIDAVIWGQQAPGIIWYRHQAMGQAIAERGKFLHANAGTAAAELLAHLSSSQDPPTVVASINAHQEGKNLQAWNRALVVEPPDNWEQLLGRHHRPGQRAETVGIWLYRHTVELQQAFEQQLARAEVCQQMGQGPQKLLSAVRNFSVNWEPVFSSCRDGEPD